MTMEWSLAIYAFGLVSFAFIISLIIVMYQFPVLSQEKIKKPVLIVKLFVCKVKDNFVLLGLPFIFSFLALFGILKGELPSE
jgi:hypothetical protein